MKETVKPVDHASAGVWMIPNSYDAVEMHGTYHVECFDADGNLKWADDAENLVTTVGKNLLLDGFFGLTAQTAIFMGLKGSGTAALADTQVSHVGWLEVGAANAPAYSGTRKTPTWSAASGGSKVMSAAASFVFTSGGTVDGCFLNFNGTSAQDNTTGTLYSAGTFSAPGARTVVATDTVSVTYTASA
jgi:hypothetical protein